MDPLQTNQNQVPPVNNQVPPTMNSSQQSGGVGSKLAIIIIVVIIIAGAVYLFNKNKMSSEETNSLPENVSDEQLTSELNSAVDVNFEEDFSDLDAEFGQ